MTKSIQEKIDKNREQIQKVLDSLNEGEITPGEARDFIIIFNNKNEYLIKSLKQLSEDK